MTEPSGNVTPFQPPQDGERQDVGREFERATLGALFIAPDQYEDVARIITGTDFRWPEHVAIFEAVKAVWESGRPIDVLLVKAELAETGKLDNFGDAYLGGLLEGVPRGANAEQYALEVKNKARARRLASAVSAATIAAQEGEWSRVHEHLEAAQDEANNSRTVRPVNVYGANVKPDAPEFTVDGFIQKGGLHLWWAVPSAGKTYAALWMVHQLLAAVHGTDSLFGHPALKIRRQYRRVLWIGTEETTGRLRYRAERVLDGMGRPTLAGELVHIWAADPKTRTTLDHLPDLVEAHNPDCVLIDPLTGLRPRTVDGRHVQWDLDNDAADEACTSLRGIAGAYGVDVVLVHHSDKGGNDYRGPTSWWASADVKVGLVPDNGRVKVTVEKMRDGAKPDPFYLSLDFTEDSVRVTYEGVAATDTDNLKPADHRILSAVRAAGEMPQYRLEAATNICRQWLSTRCRALTAMGLLRKVGEDRGSAVFVAVEKL